jgi:predicted HicB family RNase H-like nuclease
MKANKHEDVTVLNLRDMPKELVGRVKAAAALEGASLKSYVTALLQHHVNELEKKGLLPKGK